MTSLRDELLPLGWRALHRRLRKGHPIDARALDGTAYRGIALGNPGWIERLSWKTFQKTFYRDPSTGELRGWNVRVAQRGLDAPTVPLQKRGRPFTFGHYAVVPPAGHRTPAGCDRGLLIHYGLGRHGALDPMQRVRDPLVALVEGSVDVLLGASYVDLFGLCVVTPAYFLLEREGPIEYVPE